MSSARFKIRNQTTDGAWSLFADEGFDCAPGDVLELQLEDTPALDVYQTVFSDVDRSKARTAATFNPVSGEASTPTSIVEVTMPGEYGSWQIQSQTNGGVDVLDSAGRPDATVNTKSRIVAIRTALLQLRHPLAVELTVAETYDNARVAGTLQEAIDALEVAAGGGGASLVARYLTDASAAINANDQPIRALANTLNFASPSKTPATFAYQRALGVFGAALKLLRTITGGTGAPDTSTGADLEWWIPNDDVSPTLVEQVRLRPVLTTISGANLTTDFELWLVAAGVLGVVFTWHADGSATLAGKLKGLTAGGASGEAVEYDQLNTALGGYVPTTRTIAAGAGLTGGGDLSDNRSIDVAAADASITVNADSIEASGDFVAKAITTTSSVTAGAAGLIAPKWDRANAGALTLGGTNATSIACSGLGITGCVAVGSAGALAVSTAAGDLTIDADAGHAVNVATTSAGALNMGHSSKVTTITSGGEVHEIDDDKEIDSRWGSAGFTVHRRKSVTTVNNTPVAAFTFSIPASAAGHVVLRVNAVDVTNNDNAFYEKRYRFSRRSGGTSTFANVGTDIDSEDDATWQAEVTHSSPTLSAVVTGDSANQTQFDVEWWVRYETFSPV